MFKDKEAQKKAAKEAKARWQAKQAGKNAPGCPRIDERQAEGIPVGYSKQGIPSQGIPGIPEGIPSKVLPANFGQADCACQHCRINQGAPHQFIINHGQYKTAVELAANEINRQSVPCDIDYDGVLNA